MTRRAWPSLAMALLAMAGGVPVAAQLATPGRPLVEVLQENQHAGLRLLYSSELVTADLRVLSPPVARNRLALLREVLAPHGLELRQVDERTYVVSRSGDYASAMLTVRVVRADTGHPVMGARVTLLPLGRTALADVHGAVEFAALPPVDCALRISAVDHLDGFGPTLPGCRTDGAVRIDLQPAPLAEIRVSASRYSLASSQLHPRLHLTDGDLQSAPTLGSDPLRAASLLPGVALDGLSARPIFRGSEPDDILILLDGMPLRQAFHLSSYRSPFSILPRELLTDMHVSTGGFPVRHGNRTGGVIEFKTRDAALEPQRVIGAGVVDVRSLWAGRSSSGEHEWLASARRSLLGHSLDAANVNEGSPEFRDTLLAWRFQPTPRWRMQAQWLGADDELQIGEEDREFARLGGRSRYLWVQAHYDSGTGTERSFLLGHSTLRSSRLGSAINDDLAAGDVYDWRATDWWDLRATMSRDFGDGDRLEAGIEWALARARFDYLADMSRSVEIAQLFNTPQQETRQLGDDRRQRRIAAFGAWRHAWSSDSTLELGLRIQRQSGESGPRSSWTMDPRISMRHAFSNRLALRLHWGRFHQAPEAHELALEDGEFLYAAPERVDHLIAGVDWLARPNLTGRIEAYAKREAHPAPRFVNLLNTYAILAELAPDRYRIAPRAVRSQGIELSLLAEGTRWQVSWSATVARSQDLFAGRTQPRGWDQRWSMTTSLGWRRGPWQLNALWTLHDGWPTTALYTLNDATVLGPAYRERLPHYATLDLRAEFRQPLRFGELALALTLGNSLNRRNRCCTEIDAERTDAGNLILDVGELRWLPLLPQFDISWRF